MYVFGAHNSDKPGEVIGSRLVEVRHFADCNSRLRVVWLVRFVEHLQQMRALGFARTSRGKPIHRASQGFQRKYASPRLRPACWEETAVAKALPPSVAESDKVCLGDSRPGYGLRHGFFLMLLVALAFVYLCILWHQGFS